MIIKEQGWKTRTATKLRKRSYVKEGENGGKKE